MDPILNSFLVDRIIERLCLRWTDCSYYIYYDSTKWPISTVTTTQINVKTLTTTTRTTTHIVAQITTPQQLKTEQYNLEVLEIALDFIFSEDHDYYIMTIKAEYTGGESWNFHPLWITLFSDAG